MNVVPLRRRATSDSDPAGPTTVVAVDGDWDRRPELLPAEVEALAVLDMQALRRNRSRGLPRRTAASWRALARLAEPQDTARGRLHHDDDAGFRRAGLHAAAIILSNDMNPRRVR